MGKKQLAGIIAAAGLGVLVVGYGAAFAFAGDKIPGDTTVLGIPLGGLSEDEAKAKLEAGLKDRLAQPVQAQGRRVKTYQVKPAEAGLSLDVDATVDAAGAGRSLAPGRIWHALTGGDAVEPVVTADDAKLKAAVDKLAKQVNRRPPRAPSPSRTPSRSSTPPPTGLQLDNAKASGRARRRVPGRRHPRRPCRST